MGVVLVAPSVAEVIWSSGEVWRHGYTYSGHAAAAAAGLANLDIIEREGLLDRALELEQELVEVLGPLVADDRVTEVRAGTGALAAIQLSDGIAPGAALALREHGVLSRALANGSLQVSPPFVTTRADLESYASAVQAVLGGV
jgi:adenosylmethionine-8-amino-7-oxononanoate aminotransferase